MDKTSDNAHAAQGSMTASIDGQAFKAVQMEWEVNGGVLGLEDDSHFIFLSFPKDIEKGEYPIGHDEVRAYIGGTHSGEAVSGTLTLQSAAMPGRTLEGKFDFVAETDRDQVAVTGGRFTVVVGALTADQSSGRAMAKLNPPLEGNSTIKAQQVLFNGEPTAPTALFASQTEGLQGGLHRLGVTFMLQNNGQDQLSVRQAFVNVNFAAVATSELQVSQFEWQSESHLSFDFALKFSYNGKDYAIEDGSLKLRF